MNRYLVAGVFFAFMLALGFGWAAYICPVNAEYVPIVPDGLGMEAHNDCIFRYEGIELLEEGGIIYLIQNVRSGIIYAYFDIEPIFEGENPMLTHLRFFNKDALVSDDYFKAQIKSVSIRLHNATNIEKSSTDPLDDFSMYPNVSINEISFVRVEVHGTVMMMSYESNLYLWLGFAACMLGMFFGTTFLSCTEWDKSFKRWRERRENEQTEMLVMAGYLDVDPSELSTYHGVLKALKKEHKRANQLETVNMSIKEILGSTRKELRECQENVNSRGDFCSYCGANLEGVEDTKKEANDEGWHRVAESLNKKIYGMGHQGLFGKAVTVRMVCEGKCGEFRQFFGFHIPYIKKYFLVCTQCKHKQTVEEDCI